MNIIIYFGIILTFGLCAVVVAEFFGSEIIAFLGESDLDVFFDVCWPLIIMSTFYQ